MMGLKVLFLVSLSLLSVVGQAAVVQRAPCQCYTTLSCPPGSRARTYV